MRILLPLLLLLTAVLPAGAECFNGSHAVFKAHPGRDTHATWKRIDGRKCWFASGQTPGWEKPSPTPVDRLLAFVNGSDQSQKAERKVMHSATGSRRNTTTSDSRPLPPLKGGAVTPPDPVAEGRRLEAEIWSWKDMNASPELLVEGKRLLAIAMRKEARR